MLLGWKRFDENTFFRGIQLDHTFDVAQNTCLAFNANLTSVRNAAENTFIAELPLEANSIWLGGRRSEEDSSLFQWIDGTPFEFQDWAEGEPNNFRGNENCVSQGFFFTKTENWNDADCAQPRPYICRATTPQANAIFFLQFSLDVMGRENEIAEELRQLIPQAVSVSGDILIRSTPSNLVEVSLTEELADFAGVIWSQLATDAFFFQNTPVTASKY